MLEKGANPDLKAHCGATSMHFAAECGHLSVVRELLRHGGDMVHNDLGMSPLMVAAECGKEEIVNFFLKQACCERVTVCLLSTVYTYLPCTHVRLATNGTNRGLFSGQNSVHFGTSHQCVLKSNLKNFRICPILANLNLS